MTCWEKRRERGRRGEGDERVADATETHIAPVETRGSQSIAVRDDSSMSESFSAKSAIPAGVSRCHIDGDVRVGYEVERCAHTHRACGSRGRKMCTHTARVGYEVVRCAHTHRACGLRGRKMCTRTARVGYEVVDVNTHRARVQRSSSERSHLPCPAARGGHQNPVTLFVAAERQ